MPQCWRPVHRTNCCCGQMIRLAEFILCDRRNLYARRSSVARKESNGGPFSMLFVVQLNTFLNRINFVTDEESVMFLPPCQLSQKLSWRQQGKLAEECVSHRDVTQHQVPRDREGGGHLTKTFCHLIIHLDIGHFT